MQDLYCDEQEEWSKSSPFVRRLTASPYFTRLQAISQHGLVANRHRTYSRYAHSIRVACLAAHVAASLFPGNAPLLELVTLAGLAHDMGHGPFSHTFDEVLRHLLPAHPLAKHESRSMWLLRAALPEYPHLDAIQALIMGSALPSPFEPYGVLRFLLAAPLGQLDVDRLCYIQDDAAIYFDEPGELKSIQASTARVLSSLSSSGDTWHSADWAAEHLLDARRQLRQLYAPDHVGERSLMRLGARVLIRSLASPDAFCALTEGQI